MNIDGVISRVRANFGDSGGKFITNNMIFDWTNEAQDEIFRETLCKVISTSSAASTYSAAGKDISSKIAVKDVYYGDRPLSIIDRDTVNRLGLTQLETQIPYAYYVIGTSTLWLFPNVSSTDTTSVSLVTFDLITTPITAIGQALEVPAKFHNDVCLFVLSRCHERNENWQAAKTVRDQFFKNISTRKFESTTQDDTFHTVSPDVMDTEHYWVGNQ